MPQGRRVMRQEIWNHPKFWRFQLDRFGKFICLLCPHDIFTLPYALRWHQIRAGGSTNLVRAAWRRWWRGAFPPGPAWNELHIRQCHVQVLAGIGWRCSPGPASFSGIHRVEVQKRCWGPAVCLNAYLVQAALRLSSLMEGTQFFCLVPNAGVYAKCGRVWCLGSIWGGKDHLWVPHLKRLAASLLDPLDVVFWMWAFCEIL